MTDMRFTSYHPGDNLTHPDSYLSNFTVLEIPVEVWDWDHSNGLGWGINSVDITNSNQAFGGRMLYRDSGPEILPDRLSWLHPFLPSRDTKLAEWITTQNQHIYWRFLQEKNDSCFLKIVETFDRPIHKNPTSHVLFIRCTDGYVYETAFTEENVHA